MRATFLYRIFVCFVFEVLLYFFFILGHCIFYCCPMLFVVCCVLYFVTLVCLCTLYNGQVYCILAHSLPRFGGVRICQVIKLFIYCDPDCVSILIIFTGYLQHSCYFWQRYLAFFAAFIWQRYLASFAAFIWQRYLALLLLLLGPITY